MMRSRLQSIIEISIVIISMALLWIMGLEVGLRGGEGLNRAILTRPTTLLIMLYGITEFLISVYFFVAMGRQILQGGMKELLSAPVTLVNKAQYYPGIFTLGVFVGLAGDAVIIFVLEIITHLK